MQKYLGIDHGMSNIGIAFGDEDMCLAVPYDIVPGHDDQEAINMITNICQQEEITTIVFGIPLNKEGGDLTQTKIAREFAQKLEKAVGVTLILEDERFSTRMAAKLAGKNSDDSVAAAVILQGYLDRL
jgi:putative Holliday junction resolvase